MTREELEADYFSNEEYDELINILVNPDDHFLIGMKMYDKVSEELNLSKEDKEKYKTESITGIVESHLKDVTSWAVGKGLINILFLSMKDFVIYKIDGGK